MKTICEFRKDVYSKVDFRANINGRGIEHCQTIAERYSAKHGHQWNYWEMVYNKTDDSVPRIMMKHGNPYVEE